MKPFVSLALIASMILCLTQCATPLTAVSKNHPPAEPVPAQRTPKVNGRTALQALDVAYKGLGIATMLRYLDVTS